MLFDPSSNDLPKRRDLPIVLGRPKGSAWFWGDEDSVSPSATTCTRGLKGGIDWETQSSYIRAHAAGRAFDKDWESC